MSTPDAYFDRIYRSDDPFGYRQRWYERRKRHLLLATLPQEHFHAAWEIGCSNGELTVGLAPRCDNLLATDLSARAVALARERTHALEHVRIVQAKHPRDWPQESFDLIVFSEVGYYLDDEAMTATARALGTSLNPDGVLVACHWRHAFTEAPRQGDDVHACLDVHLGLSRLFAYRDGDIRLEGWVDARGEAMR